MVDLTPWKRVKVRFEAGESVPLAVREMAEKVLGERFVRAAKRVRPDFRDREAGDDSFDDNDGDLVGGHRSDGGVTL
jgi:hypothetical protein